MIYALYLLTIIVLVSADQFTKFLITSNFKEKIVLVKDFFYINYVKNYGAGFSILQNQKYFLIAISLIAIVIIGYLLVTAKKKESLNKICYLLIIGGSIGNLIDRLSLGYVIDFLDFFIFGYDFPVFNLADCYITIGCFLLIISILLESKNAKN